MKDAAEHIVPQSYDIACDGGGGAGGLFHGGGESRILRASAQRAAGSGKNGLVIHRQPQIPGIIKCADWIFVMDTVRGVRWRPITVEWLGRCQAIVQFRLELATVLIQLRMKHDCRGDDQHGSFGRLVVAAGNRLPHSGRVASRQIQCLGEIPLLRFTESAHCQIQAYR